MALNRAIQPTKWQGEPSDNYVLTTIPKPNASLKNVVLRVVLSPVNPLDLFNSRHGVWKNLDLNSVVVGSEGVGVVTEVGEGVTKLKAGHRVVPLIFARNSSSGYGVWRDYVEVPEIDCIPVPDNIPDAYAAQLISSWTAYGLLKRIQIPKGNYLLQTAAGSALGRQIIEIAKHYGIKTINVVRRDEWIQPLKDIGADYVINSSKEDVKGKVKEITGGKGAYAALDPVATESTRVVASSVRDGGEVLVYGMLSGNDVRVDIADLMRQVTLSMYMVSDFSDDLAKREETASEVFALLSKKVTAPLIGKTYPFEEFQEAIKEAERDARGGKVYLSSYSSKQTG